MTRFNLAKHFQSSHCPEDEDQNHLVIQSCIQISSGPFILLHLLLTPLLSVCWMCSSFCQNPYLLHSKQLTLLSQITSWSLKSLQMPLPTGNFPWLLQKREESHIGYSIPSSTHSPGSTGHHTWNRSMQGKHFSSLMHHSSYHTIPAHLISAVRISFGLYHGGF